VEKRFTHIELFAGCGGMSLGLEASGFELYFANELSPMAGETFAFNVLGENLEALIDVKGNNSKLPEKVLWLRSKHGPNALSKRLRENPFEYIPNGISDISPMTELKGKLLIGDIKQLVEFFKKKENSRLLKEVKDSGIDLLSGGPPCQGFSLAGKRIKDDHKNHLPGWFAEFAGLLKPKVVLLENVKGITSAFKEGDKHYYAYLEVAKAFALEGYIPVCTMLNSKYFKIPQNRPRFILLGLREDIYKQFINSDEVDSITKSLLLDCHAFFDHVMNSKENLDKIKRKELPLINIENQKHRKYFNGNLLPEIVTSEGKFISAEEALHDLRDAQNGISISSLKNTYMEWVNKKFKNVHSSKELKNQDYRSHSPSVKTRFRVYQLINDLNGQKNDAIEVFFGDSPDLRKSKAIFERLTGKKFYFAERNDLIAISNFQEFMKYKKKLATKKHSQRALKRHEPAPAQLTIPDDVCHYDQDQLRTMTVREMARLQSFPDWFIFKSKITTGGKQRSYQVPQYTQVGNAVPPLLAYQLGKTISTILTIVDNGQKRKN
jgi:DNA (cytosine-5)-methyltransferase 1